MRVFFETNVAGLAVSAAAAAAVVPSCVVVVVFVVVVVVVVAVVCVKTIMLKPSSDDVPWVGWLFPSLGKPCAR